MDKLAQSIFGRRAAFYATSAEHKDQKVLNRLIELACVHPGDRMLDVSTGTGHTAFAFAPHLRKVVATDITWEMIAQGRQLQAELGLSQLLPKRPNAEFDLWGLGS